MFKKEIFVGGFNFVLKKFSGQKNTRITIRSDGKLLITAPFSFSQKKVEELILKQKSLIEKGVANFEKLRKESKIKSEIPVLDEKQLRKAKKFAKLVVEQKLKIFNSYYNFSYERLTIRDQKTRWGSCSSLGSLSFNYRIIYLPESLRDYIVVHELCHLKEMNHSVNFWNLVAEKIPDFREKRRELKKIKF